MRSLRCLALCALGFALVGCTGSHSTSDVTGSSPAGTNTTAESGDHAAALSTTAVVALRIAHDITPTGAARGVSLDIEPWAPKIVAVVDVGGWQGFEAKTLEFHWSQIDAAGAEAQLFTQHVDVKPGQRAFATALSTGRLALGTYRVTVAVAGTTESVDLFVATPEAEEPLTAAAVAAASDTSSTVPSSMRRQTPHTSKQTNGSTPGTDSSDQQVAVGEPPTAGDVGAVAGDSGANPAPAPQGCTLTIAPSDAGSSAIWAQASGCGNDSLVLAVTAGGKELDVPLAGAAGEFDMPYDVDPCSFGLAGNAAADVTYVMKVVAGPDKGKVSAAYTGKAEPKSHDQPPSVLVTGTPGGGTFVVPGEQIALRVEASDDVHVSRVEVTVSPGNPDTTLADQKFVYHLRPCGGDFDHQTVTPKPYVVPANPPEFITFTVTATDSQGTHQTAVVQYPTRGVWYGTVTGTTSSNGPNFSCEGSYQGPIRVVVDSSDTSKGPVAVTGDAQFHARVGGCPFPANFPTTGDITFKLTGTFDGQLFKLQLEPSGIENSAAWAVGVHLFSYPAPGLTINAIRHGSTTYVANSTFHRENSGSEELNGGGAVSTLDGRISLDCCSPNAEPVVPVKPRPVFLGADD